MCNDNYILVFLIFYLDLIIKEYLNISFFNFKSINIVMRQILNILHMLNSNRIKTISMLNGGLDKDFNLEYSQTKEKKNFPHIANQ